MSARLGSAAVSGGQYGGSNLMVVPVPGPILSFLGRIDGSYWSLPVGPLDGSLGWPSPAASPRSCVREDPPLFPRSASCAAPRPRAWLAESDRDACAPPTASHRQTAAEPQDLRHLQPNLRRRERLCPPPSCLGRPRGNLGIYCGGLPARCGLCAGTNLWNPRVLPGLLSFYRYCLRF
jgi:hypothetical protein